MQKSLENQPFSGNNGDALDEAGRAGVEAPNAALTTDAGEGIDMADSDSTPGKSPAFQFYPKDFITDERVTLMSMSERGVYITLICKCWTEGTLPADDVLLSRLCGLPTSAFRRFWPAIAPCFRAHQTKVDRLVHPRLEKERQKQRAFRRKQAENGRKGGRPSRVDKPTDNPSLLPVANPPKSSAFPISNLRSASSETNIRARAVDDVAERAGKFCNEVYPELYAKYRKGARYVSKPALDFQEALQLCRTWDDERLVKIATVFLTTDHEFAEKGSRTMAQFRSMASWCDSRLAERGIA